MAHPMRKVWKMTCSVCHKQFPAQGSPDLSGITIDWSPMDEQVVCSISCAVSCLDKEGSFSYEIVADG